MNLMNQRRDLSDLYENKIIEKTMLESALRGPVFVCDALHKNFTDDEKQWLADNVMYDSSTSDGCFPKIVPFEVFRLSYPHDGSYSQWWFDMETHIAATILRAGEKDISKRFHHAHFRFGITRWKPEVKANVFLDFKEGFQEPEMQEPIQKVFNAHLRDLIHFLFDVMSSTSTIVKVTDDQPGRSVQWRLNREHYLVLNHHQAQTMQKNKRGVTDKDLVRGAHWRRAHLRRLSSDKFKHKKGLLVPVKKAWVGPEEWKGHDGKIYKVTELKKVDN